MGSMRVKILDVSGSRSSEVETPDDVAVNRILLLLVEKMNLPLHSPDGQIMSYKLHHRRTGQQLLDNQTLAQSGVQSGDELRLQPEITAGGGRSPFPFPVLNRNRNPNRNLLSIRGLRLGLGLRLRVGVGLPTGFV